MNFKETREFIAVCHAFGDISEEDFVILSEAFSSKNPDLPYKSYAKFNLDEIDEDECLAELRFMKEDMPTLAAVLGIPNIFKCPQGTICNGLEALCLLLRRLAYPCRLSDLVLRFGRSVPELSLILSQATDFIYNQHSHLICDWNEALLRPGMLEAYAAAISARGAALNNCFGFIDGTVRAICRPQKHQRVVYNGHKRFHALKFQSVALPNGMIAHLYGPVGKVVYFELLIKLSTYYSMWNYNCNYYTLQLFYEL